MDHPIEENETQLSVPVDEAPVAEEPVSEVPDFPVPVVEEAAITDTPIAQENAIQDSPKEDSYTATTPRSKETFEQSIAEIAANIFDSDALIHQLPVDSVVKSVLSKFVSRAEFGMKKYGTNLDRKDLNVLDWIQHAQEEHMDAILYLEKLKKEVKDTSIAAQKILSQLPDIPLTDSTEKFDKNVFKKIADYFCGLVKK